LEKRPKASPSRPKPLPGVDTPYEVISQHYKFTFPKDYTPYPEVLPTVSEQADAQSSELALAMMYVTKLEEIQNKISVSI
jgi:hypothetical protein